MNCGKCQFYAGDGMYCEFNKIVYDFTDCCERFVMTLEELKIEADKLGYKLIKNNPMPKPKPCVCGCRKIEEWSSKDGTLLKCHNCGLVSALGKNRREVINNWNNLICHIETVSDNIILTCSGGDKL